MTISKYLASVVLCGLTFSPVILLADEGSIYSPYIDDDYPNQVYFGDTHLPNMVIRMAYRWVVT
jgi:hypothetical protein